MRYRLGVLVWVLFTIGLVAGNTSSAVAQGETVQKLAVVYSCETPDCTDADGVKDQVPGATVTSFDAAGTEIDACTTDEYGQCALLIPVAEDGTYKVVAGTGFEDYNLLSSTPESTGEGGDGREWTFVPSSAEPSADTAVNVVACDVAGCTDPVTMDGAIVEAYQAGELTDSCTVSSAPDEFDGCRLVVGTDQVGFEVIPADGFENYVLVSDEPKIYDIEGEGSGYQLYLWTFVPADDVGEVTPEPTATAEATQEPGAVSRLPETGAGSPSALAPDLALLVLACAGIGSFLVAASLKRNR
jgi:hypothetical protein